MKLTGTMINYYFHCKRQCYLFANKINMEDNSEEVRIGKVLHELELKEGKNTEIKFNHISIDKMTSQYIVELKKSDADPQAAKMQLLFYLKELQAKGIYKKGKLLYFEKNKTKHETIIELTEANLHLLDKCEEEMINLISGSTVPELEPKKGCKKCAYYEYCYI